MNAGTTTSSSGRTPERPERERDRLGAVGDADHVAHAEVRRELLLERRDLGTEDVDAALDHLREAFEDLLAEREKRGLGVEQADRHRAGNATGSRP